MYKVLARVVVVTATAVTGFLASKLSLGFNKQQQDLNNITTIDPSKWNELTPSEQKLLLNLVNSYDEPNRSIMSGIHAVKDSGEGIYVKLENPIFKLTTQEGTPIVYCADKRLGQGVFASTYRINTSLQFASPKSVTTIDKICVQEEKLVVKIMCYDVRNETDKIREFGLSKKALENELELTQKMLDESAKLFCNVSTSRGRNYAIIIERLVPGQTLDSITFNELPYTQRQVVFASLHEQIKRLYYANVAHHDLKPLNVIADLQTEKATAIDFGLSKETSDPKMLHGNNVALYALGVLMLTGNSAPPQIATHNFSRLNEEHFVLLGRMLADSKIPSEDKMLLQDIKVKGAQAVPIFSVGRFFKPQTAPLDLDSAFGPYGYCTDAGGHRYPRGLFYTGTTSEQTNENSHRLRH